MTILFDLDGTLIDSTDAILQGFEVSYKELGKEVPPYQDIIDLIGYPLDIMYTKLGVQGNPWDYVDAYKSHYKKISKQMTTLLPNAKEAIEEASKNYTLGVVTTKTACYSHELLEHMDVMKYFDCLIGRDSVKNPKPHEEPILKAMKELSADPKNTWMVGDAILDLQSAKNAKIKSVGVLCGYGKKTELQKYTSFLAINSLEAVKIINKF